MMAAGYKSIEAAKGNGSWTFLDEVDELIPPKDLDAELAGKPGSKEFFLSLSKTARKSILQWLVLANSHETRQKRVAEIVEQVSQK